MSAADVPSVAPAHHSAPTTSPMGRRAFIAGTAGAIVGAAVVSSAAGAVEPGASFFESQAPRRLADTRENRGFTRIDANTIRVKVGGNGSIPVDAVAAVFTVTGVNNSFGDNFVTCFPGGSARPNTSNLNFNSGENTLANLVTVMLGTGANQGFVDVYTFRPCDILVDIAGVYRPSAVPVAEGRLVTTDPMFRALDTRHSAKPEAGSSTTVNLNGIVPADATAVVGNLTAVGAEDWGFLTAYPLDAAEPPNASNVNVVAGDIRAAGTMTKLGTKNGVRGISVFTFSKSHILYDVAGYITGPSAGPGSDGMFVPIAPTRLLDTRNDKRRLWPGWTRSFQLPSSFSAKAQAVAMNLTCVNAMGSGFFTVYGARLPRYEVSNLNVETGKTVANHVITKCSTEGVATYSQQGSHLIGDVTGWFTGGAAPPTQPAPSDPPPPPADLPWTLNVPRMGLVHAVFGAANADPIVDRGDSWYWTGTGLVGQDAHTAAFGHRTSQGGPYRQQHTLVPGDLLFITTPDNRLYTYRFVNERLTGSFSGEILDATRIVGGPTFSLIACTGSSTIKDDQPRGGIAFRIVSNFELVEWADLG